jgi:hypothetical protein
MGMYGHRDIVVNPNQWKPMLEGIPHARIERFPRAGHFIMLDEPKTFQATLRSFLEQEETEVDGQPVSTTETNVNGNKAAVTPANPPAPSDSPAPLVGS